ncbi:MAG: PLP-dependent transferase, partial [Bacteroidetes bacterium]|nr:PLP-dependent transferase [Bacteroidota bacterium]
MLTYIKSVVQNMPLDWLNQTTHRLDVYDEKYAKTQFIDLFKGLYENNNADTSALSKLPTAYDYIRLGHPLSCILEWVIADLNKVPSESVISFSSKSAPLLAILRKNLLDHKSTQILYRGDLPKYLDFNLIRSIYGYNFELKQIDNASLVIPNFEGSTVFISETENINHFDLSTMADFYIHTKQQLGSVILVNGEHNNNYVSEIQHVRRRETIAMTPVNCLAALNMFLGNGTAELSLEQLQINKLSVLESIASITGSPTKALVASSGLSIQYAIMMGLVHDAAENHPGKAIKFIVPPNCYGGTNDQARRVAACLDNVEIVDLPVDGDQDMVQSIDRILEKIALENAVPYIIAEIPTNPRVEVPDLLQLKETLARERKTTSGAVAIAPVFVLDQTFCPNVHFLGEGKILSAVSAISYASGSKFPSGGKCTAGYCVGNQMAAALMPKIEIHLALCDNEATYLQYEYLAQQLPSMNQRIVDAYANTREFVNFINEVLPEAKINFVSEELASQGFMPSVFSLDLPTKGTTYEERESHKRALNHRLIHLMITEIPNESKYCVSYGQLKGCYWTIPATSTQGTT